MQALVLLLLLIIGAAVAAPIFLSEWAHEMYGIPKYMTIWGVIGFVFWALVIRRRRAKNAHQARVRAIRLTNVDSMDGLQFEHYLGHLMTLIGYEARVTQGSGDLGVDVVAVRNDISYAVQAKRQSRAVSRRAVSDAVAGKIHYGCQFAMVVTNNRFSKGAIQLAQSTGCILVDREILTDWILTASSSDTASVAKSKIVEPEAKLWDFRGPGEVARELAEAAGVPDEWEDFLPPVKPR